MRRTRELLHVGLWLAMAGYGMPAAAGEEIPAADWEPVDAEQLDQVRGGFTTGSGLEMSLGIERLVLVNGAIVAHTNIELSDLNNVSAEQARLTSEALSSVKLIQNGGDNIYHAGASDHVLGATVIQNSLNDQLIASQTVISCTLNSASLLKTLNFQGSLSDALARAAGPR